MTHKLRLFSRLFLATLVFMTIHTALRAQYCPASFTNLTDDWITNVTFSNINNSSGSTTYSDFTSQVANVNTGSSYLLSVTVLTTGGPWVQYCSVWIDWDQDQVFEDLTERYDLGSQSINNTTYTFTQNILVPVNALPGPTRMRVIEKYNAPIPAGACNPMGSSYGEVEDYTVNVSAQPCVAPPTAGTTLASNAMPCNNTPISLSLQGSSGGQGLTYQWETSPDNIAWTPALGETNPSFSTTATVDMYYRCILTCSGQSDTSAPVLVTVVTCINMSNGTSVNICAANFFDSGGPNGSYQNYEDYTYTITPTAGNFAQVTFNTFSLETCCDWLMIYDGNSINAPLIGQFVTNPGTITSSASDGSLTFVFHSDVSVTPFGWDATMICVPQPVNDAGLSALISPSVPSTAGCNVNDTLIVELTTVGFTNLTSATINASVNNGPPLTYNWTGNLGQYQTVIINAGILNLNDGDVVKVWTSNPNNTTDDQVNNDTITLTVYDALSGPYTVAGTNPDFATITDARNALLQRGICGDVVFNIRNGVYTEHFTLPPMLYTAGAYGSTVTFQSEILNADSVTMEFTPGGSADNYIVRFDGADHIIFNEMTLSNLSTTYARVIEYRASSDSNEVRNSVIKSDTVNFGDNFDKITIVSTADNDDYNKIINNEIWGGSRAISLGGVSLVNPEVGTVIDSNVFRHFYFVGSAIFNQSAPVINNNNYFTNSVNTNIFRIYANNVNNGIQVNGNRTYGSQGGFGINLDNVSGNTNLPGVVSNNFIYMGDSIGVANSEGIYVQNQSSMIDVMHNSIHVMNDNPNSAGISVGLGTGGGASGIRLMNNNVVNSGMGKALYVSSSYNIGASDYNNFFTANDAVFYFGTTYTTVAAYSSGTGFDGNSFDVDPMFVGEDLHTCRVELDNAGTPVGTLSDFDGDIRNTNTPDIGADEFIGSKPIDLGPDTMVCSGTPIDFGVEYIQGADYLWQPFQDTTAGITAVFAGQYILTVTSACGTQSDTVNLVNVPVPTATFTTTTNFFTVITNNGSTNGVTYHWDFGDGTTSTEFSPSHVYGNNGPFVITLTVYNECGDSAQYIRQVNITAQHVGIEELGTLSMEVFPNPTDGPATIRVNYSGSDQVTVRIEDIAGRVVQTQQVQATGGELLIPVDMSTVMGGTYFIRLSTANHETVKKLIVR